MQISSHNLDTLEPFNEIRVTCYNDTQETHHVVEYITSVTNGVTRSLYGKTGQSPVLPLQQKDVMWLLPS